MNQDQVKALIDEAESALARIIPLAGRDEPAARKSSDRVREILQQLRSAGTPREGGSGPLLGNDIE